MALMNRFPSADSLVCLELEELGAALLMEFREAQRYEKMQAGMYGGTSPNGIALSDILDPIKGQRNSVNWAIWPQVQLAVHEAWGWLACAGLIMKHPERNSSYIMTRRGAQLATEQDVADYHDHGVLPTGLLHPRIMTDVRSHFTPNQFDTAVFHAFREIEIVLREVVPGDPKRTGRELVKDAFNPTTGKLRNPDTEVPDSEREGEFALFNGAISTHKNPGSHRKLPLERAETARLVLFASHLLFLLDDRTSGLTNNIPSNSDVI